MNRTTTRWRVPLWAWLPVGAAVAAEATSNALRAYGLGSHLDHFTVAVHGQPVSLSGAVLVLAAIAVSLSQTRAAWVALTPSGPARQRIVAGALAVLLLAISVSAMASHILEAQRAKTGGESHDRTAYAAAEAAYSAAKADFDRLGAQRTTAEVRASMEAVKISAWAWEESRECTADSVDLKRRLGSQDIEKIAKACSPFKALRVEMAGAISKADAADRLEDARAAMAKTTPIAEATADEATVSRLWGWIMGLGVVLLATFGAVIFARVERVAVPVSGADTDQTSFAGSAPVDTFAGELPDPPTPRRRPLRSQLPANVVSFSGNRSAPANDRHPVIVALESVGGSVASNHALAVLMGVTDGEASKRTREVAGLLAIERIGKETRISLKSAVAVA